MSPRQLVLGCSFLACFAASAQTVYTWKDAKGVTHYSDAPPPKTAAEARTVPVAPPPSTPAPAVRNPPPASTSTSATTAEDARNANEAAAQARCARARANLTALQGSAPVGPDHDGDGQPDATLTPEERAAEVAAMQSAVASSCPGGA